MKRFTAVLIGLILLIFTFQANAESPFIYGIHDHDTNPQEYLDHIRNGGATGWVTATVAIGSNPNDYGGTDFSNLSDQGHTVIVRLNNGYCPNGTIPEPAKYADFAQRAANFVAASQGANIWIIGNETNLAGEWPVVNGRLQYVSPQDYATCFRLAYNAIKQVRPDAKVLPQALAPFAGPYNTGSTCGYSHDANPLNWVQYMNQMLTAIKSSGGIDGIALHINSRGYTYGDIHSTQKVQAGGQDLYFSFYVYKDWIDLGIPSDLYHLPLYATESNGIFYWSGGHPERPDSHYEAGWMQEIYAEINRYNQSAAATGKPVFRSVNMYRWCAWCDGWNIDGSPYKGQILADLDQAVAAGYRWPDGDVEPPPPPDDQPPGDNLALEAVDWSASSSYNSDFGGNKAYDGLITAGSKWTSNGSGAESWLALDLGAVREITGFIVRHAGDAAEPAHYNTQSYRVESGSSLSGPWSGQATVSNQSQANATTSVLADRVTARYVRLYITDAGIDNYARIPEFEVYGFAVSTPPPPGSALVNGGFEASTGGNDVGQGWTAFSSAGYDANFNVVNDPSHGGSSAQEIFSPQPSTNDQFAGVYQAIATNPGTSYVVRAWNQTSFPGGHQWDHIARLGIDLSGGTDFQAGSVTWYEFDSAKQIWHQLEFDATATGTAMTVFLQSWHKWASGGNAWAWFDDVQVTAAGVDPPDNQNPVAVIAAAPTRGAAPLAVTFNADGSSDPDGDDLSYACDFGVGAQASESGIDHSYPNLGTYTAALTVSDGKGGSDTTTVVITVTDGDPLPGNNAPQAVFTASPRTGKAPLTVAFDAGGSSDPDGDSLIFSWQFGDGSQGSGSSVAHTFQNVGSYSTILTVSDGRGGSDTSSIVISVTSGDIPMPWYCPSALNFDEIRAQLNQQGQDLAHVKIGFHVGPAGNANGLGDWMRCLDAAGVPFFIKSADSAGQIWEAAQLKAASGVPHVLVYRKSIGDGWSWDVPDYNKNPYDAAVEHWQRQRNEFPPELEEYKHLIWVETINEVDKNRSEWLGEFAYHTAHIAMEQGFNWAAFGWSSGEPEREHWQGPWMQKFLQLAGQYPDRVAVALHEYSYVQENLDRYYPYLVGRFQMLYEVCDASGIPRPTVVITEFGWVYNDIANSVNQAMEVDLPWAAELYAPYPQVLGASIWYLGPGFGDIDDKTQQLIAPMTEYSLQNYFVIPQESSTPDVDPIPTGDAAPIGEVGFINDTLDHGQQTIELNRSYQNPVVFAQAVSQDGGDTSVVRITDVQSDHFSLYLQEAPNKDGWHTPEAVSYLVLEAGSWALDDGTRLEVGTVVTGATVGHGIDNVWQPINFTSPFAGAPVIFSQVQGINDPHWVKTRQQNSGPAGFELSMEEEENKASYHGLEAIGWMAIEDGAGVWNGHPFEAVLTPDAVTHTWHTITFGQNFMEAPRLITSLATFDGADSSHLRYDRTSLSAESVALRVEEDTAGDTETVHTTERVGILAIEQSGLLTAKEY